MAKDLVRTRNNVTKFYKMRTELQAVSLRIQVSTAVGGAPFAR
jgi:charged multivesicular body protein 2A